MKNGVSFLYLLVLFSCNKKNENTTTSPFTEEEAYEVINTFIKDQKDLPILWNDRQLVAPPIEYTTVSFEEIPEIPSYDIPFPVFTKSHWKIEKLKNIVAFDSKEYDYFFANENREQQEIDKRNKEWQTRFKDHYLYNVSYPMYNQKAEVVIFDVYFYKTLLYCGTGLHQTYFYKKTTNGWSKGINCNGCN